MTPQYIIARPDGCWLTRNEFSRLPVYVKQEIERLVRLLEIQAREHGAIEGFYPRIGDD